MRCMPLLVPSKATSQMRWSKISSRFGAIFQFKFHIMFDLVRQELKPEVVLKLENTAGSARLDILTGE